MRLSRIYFLLILFSCVVLCCTKATSNPEEMAATLKGTWEIRQSYSGMMPHTNYSAGNGFTVSFDGVNFAYKRDGQTVHQGIYQLKSDTIVDVSTCYRIPPKDTLPNSIVFQNGQNSSKSSFELTGNTLKLSSGCLAADGGWSVYKKIDEKAR